MHHRRDLRASVLRIWTSISPCAEGRPGKVQIALTCTCFYLPFDWTYFRSIKFFYMIVTTCIAIQSERSSTVWRELSRLSAVCKEEDRSAFRSRFLFLARSNRTCALPTQLLRLRGLAALRVGYENNTY